MESESAAKLTDPQKCYAANWQDAVLPPMLVQYLEYKRNYPDCIILFQVGDFYEVFFEDALTISHKINLTLTSRDKNSANPVPMCGVPVATIDGYLDRMVEQGLSVAVVSQLNSPSEQKNSLALSTDSENDNAKNQSAKIAVQRKLTRVVTPGVRILANNPALGEGALVAALAIDSEHEAACAYTDVQTGIVQIKDGLSVALLFQELRKLRPAEIILPTIVNAKRIDGRTAWVKRLEQMLPQSGIKYRTGSLLDNLSAERSVNSGRDLLQIHGYAQLGQAARRAARLLLGYLDEVTVDARVKIHAVQTVDERAVMNIDATTRDNLELVRNSKNGSFQGTLFALLNRTVTPGGERLLRQWILQPLTDLAAIEARQDAVASCLAATNERADLFTRLRGVSDLERIAARLELNIAGPRELAALRDGLAVLPQVTQVLSGLAASTAQPNGLLARLKERLQQPAELYQLLLSALSDSPGFSLADGNIIRAGFNADLDRLREIRTNGQRWMEELEAAERARTGISSLKIKFNQVLGFFIEITRANLSKVPGDYLRRQSTVNCERFTTDALRAREREVLGAEDRERQLEKRLFDELRQDVARHSSETRAIAEGLNELDLLLALAEAAERENYIRPQLDESSALLIEDGKHPVLARLLESHFIPNTIQMKPGQQSCLVITGPNMGGKSTYLRQAGLIVIMAQMGSFVPAKSARVGIVDRIYARIGASDNISEGESTFMVEMREAANIISGATSRSLLLIDEIGRGTATTDGLAIAQAILEWIVVKLSCRALFATHFHELTVLAEHFPTLGNLSVGSVERGDDVIFTHEICVGPASKSYGVEVAKLANLPPALLERAREILVDLLRRERDAAAVPIDLQARASASKNQLSLFGVFSEPKILEKLTVPADYHQLQSIKECLVSIDLNNLTPLEALVTLHKLQNEANGEK